MNSVVVENFTKKFNKTDPSALTDINLQIKSQKITGLIGPDGAGKSTLIRCIAGLLRPTDGKILTMGLDSISERDLINQKIGYMPQKNGVYDDLTILENLTLFAHLKGVEDGDFESIFDELLRFTDLKAFKNRLAGDLSGGMRQKLGLACALLGKPQLLLLDEPSVGVDPISRLELVKIVRTLQSKGLTVVWATAYLDEAQNFDECILLDNGKILYNGGPEELTQKLDGRVFSLPTEGSPSSTIKNIRRNWKGVIDATVQSNSIRVVFKENAFMDYARLIPTAPRFEDAVIDILGGSYLGESKLAAGFKGLNNYDVDYAIEAEGLVKKYGSFFAVNNFSFKVKKGEIFGLLGPNGAGKSTTFKMLCGLATPTQGRVDVLGQNMQKNPSKARSYLGYMAQKFSLYGNMTVMQNLEFFSGIYGLTGRTRREKIDEMISIFRFKRYLQINAEELPLGYKQRLALVCATMHSPPILFLDEPTSGVDPLTRREFWNHINSLAENGVTVMITTHFMNEAEYCDRICMFYRGEAIALGTPLKLKTMAGENAGMEETFVKLIEDFENKRGKK